MQQQPDGASRLLSSNRRRRWLQTIYMARVGLALLLVGVALSSSPSYYALLMYHLCAAEACLPGQLTAEELQALHTFGLSRSAFAVFTVGYNLLMAVGFFTVAIVLPWRRPAEWYPFLIA